MTQSLRQLFDTAYFAVSRYKGPDITEFQTLLDKILAAAAIGRCEHCCIESLDEDEDEVTVVVSWSSRGCENTSTYTFPSSILDDVNPVDAARIWGIQKQITEVEAEVKDACLKMNYGNDRLVALKSRLANAVSAKEIQGEADAKSA